MQIPNEFDKVLETHFGPPRPLAIEDGCFHLYYPRNDRVVIAISCHKE